MRTTSIPSNYGPFTTHLHIRRQGDGEPRSAESTKSDGRPRHAGEPVLSCMESSSPGLFWVGDRGQSRATSARAAWATGMEDAWPQV
jgi:hypothetical protein